MLFYCLVQVARESALSFVPDADITAIHGSVTTSEYGVSFYKQVKNRPLFDKDVFLHVNITWCLSIYHISIFKFALVLNALDNRAARSHVNRMCLAADVPLVESGTAGYLGQVKM